MKNVATIEMKNVAGVNVKSETRAKSANVLRQWAEKLAVLFSFILGEKVSATYSLCLLNAIVSGFSAFFFGGASLLVQFLLILWFVVAVWQAKLNK